MGEAVNIRRQLWATEFLVDLNPTQASLRAGYSPNTATSTGKRMLADPWVRQLVHEGMAERTERTKITADMVLQRWWDIATADPRQLVTYERSCCRYCHGDDFKFQRTIGEFERDAADFQAALEAWPQGKPKPEFDMKGGIGYDRTLDPHPDCPECNGQGVGEAAISDTRNLHGAAAALYAGVKVTRNGLEVQMHDQLAALNTVAKHLGMLTDTTRHIGGETGDAPIQFMAVFPTVDGNQAPDTVAPSAEPTP